MGDVVVENSEGCPSRSNPGIVSKEIVGRGTGRLRRHREPVSESSSDGSVVCPGVVRICDPEHGRLNVCGQDTQRVGDRNRPNLNTKIVIEGGSSLSSVFKEIAVSGVIEGDVVGELDS